MLRFPLIKTSASLGTDIMIKLSWEELLSKKQIDVRSGWGEIIHGWNEIVNFLVVMLHEITVIFFLKE